LSAAVLSIEDVSKTYGRVKALQGVTFAAGPGEIVGLLGHNGAGKSTLLKLVCGQLAPTAGRVLVDGVDVRRDPDGARARLGIVPEDPSLYEYLTAREFLEFVVDVRGAGSVEDGLAVADLDGDADRLIREYSQGMRRRVALAAALVARPPVVILDEALNGLDPPSAARVVALLRTRASEGASIVLSTHVVEIVERVATRVVVLEHGRVVRDVRVADLAAGELAEMAAGLGR
jgi:ABC-2 type transport system ATP-binding protein